jgi:hypothetical protein
MQLSVKHAQQRCDCAIRRDVLADSNASSQAATASKVRGEYCAKLCTTTMTPHIFQHHLNISANWDDVTETSCSLASCWQGNQHTEPLHHGHLLLPIPGLHTPVNQQPLIHQPNHDSSTLSDLFFKDSQ